MEDLGITLQLSRDAAAILRQKQRQQWDSSTVDPSDAANLDGSSSQDDSNLRTRPSVLLMVDKLIGYSPTSADELESVRSSLIRIMWTQFRQSEVAQHVDATEFPTDDAVPPLDFDDHVTQMFDSQVADFVVPTHDGSNRETTKGDGGDGGQEDAKTADTGRSTINISYPPRILSRSTGKIVETHRLWNDTCSRCTKLSFERSARHQGSVDITTAVNRWRLRPGGVGRDAATVFPAMERLLGYLLVCNRGLFWKSDMSIELQRLWRQEVIHADYIRWRNEERQHKLDQLYQVRETIAHQLEVSDGKMELLKQKRAEAVVKELRRRRVESALSATASASGPSSSNNLLVGDGGLQGFDFESTIMSFPSEFKLLSLYDEQDDEDYQHDDDSWRNSDDDTFDDEFDNDDSFGEDADDDYDDNDAYSQDDQKEDRYDNGYADDERFDDSSDHALKYDQSQHMENAQDADRTEPNMTRSRQDVSIGDAGNGQQYKHPGDNDTSGLYVLRRREERPHPCQTPSKPSLATHSRELPTKASSSDGLDDGTRAMKPAATIPRRSAFKRRKQRAKQQRREARIAEREAKHKAMLDAAMKQEQAVTEQCTTTEFVVAQSMNMALRDKLNKTDELLEVMQDEEWEAEEEREAGNSPDSEEGDEGEFGLLDQILAMILGAMPLGSGGVDGQAEHFEFVRKEHLCIVQEWKEHFGRLPPLLKRQADDDENSEQSAEGAFDGEEHDTNYRLADEDDNEEEGEDDSANSTPNPTKVSTHGSTSDVPYAMQSQQQRQEQQHLTAEEQRQAMGIEEHDVEDWEDVEDW